MAIIMNSVGNYLKTMKLKTQWHQREKDEKGMDKSTPRWMRTKESDKKKAQELGISAIPEKNDNTLGNIQSKIKAGKTLTVEEKKYLEEHDPASLEKAEKNEIEKKNFERDLKKCRTKEDVQRLRMQYANMSISRIKAVENNPNIPESKKLEICIEENGKTMAVEESIKTYIVSGKYGKLPTDAELNETEKQEAEDRTPVVNEKDENNMEEKEEIDNNTSETDKEIKLPEEFIKTDTKPDPETVEKVRKAKATAAYRKVSMTESSNFTEIKDMPEISIVDKLT